MIHPYKPLQPEDFIVQDGHLYISAREYERELDNHKHTLDREKESLDNYLHSLKSEATAWIIVAVLSILLGLALIGLLSK